MTAAEVERYLHEHIPISAAHGIGVRAASGERVVLTAPLAANINHFGSVYGGSASSAAILAAWTLLHLRLSARGWAGRVVIQRSRVDYLRPTTADFQAVCLSPEPRIWDRFLSTLERRGRARLTISSVIECEGEETARFEGDYVALATASRAASGARGQDLRRGSPFVFEQGCRSAHPYPAVSLTGTPPRGCGR